jgi:hypothetical protein
VSYYLIFILKKESVVLTKDSQISKILSLGDELASAATSFTSQQGYDQFIRARDNFHTAVISICCCGSEDQV